MSDSQRRAMFAKMNRNQFQFYGLGQRAVQGAMTPGGLLEPRYFTDPWGSAYDIGRGLVGSGTAAARRAGSAAGRTVSAIDTGIRTPGGALGAFSWTDPRSWLDYGTDVSQRAGRFGYTAGRSAFGLPTGMATGAGDVLSAGRYPWKMAWEYPAIATRGAGAAIGAGPRGIYEGLTTGQVGPYNYGQPYPGPYPMSVDPSQVEKAGGLMEWIKKHPTETALAVGLGGLGVGLAMSE